MTFIPVYILILFFTIVIDYLAGIMIENSGGKRKKVFLVMSIIANVGVLAIFKYYNFFVDNMNDFLHGLSITTRSVPLLNIILPIGLSFHTFQAMSYTIEVYRGKQKAEKHFGIYALYVMFYPQLVAGPIERPQNILHQFYEKHYFDIQKVSDGLRIMLWGYFIKLVIADRLALYVNSVYNNIGEHSGTTLLLATVFFAFQIYCDFAGYSYIAIGCARVMGFDLMTNFRRPYFAKSIDEFWKRWHISLSTWFRDYVYISLGGNRVSIPRWYFNLLLVFMLSGLWHGANWTYIVWGGLNGLYLISALIIKRWGIVFSPATRHPALNVVYNTIEIITTFALVALAWVFFRANNISDAFLVVKKIFLSQGPLFTSSNPTILPCSILGILFLLLVEFRQEYFQGKALLLNNSNAYIRYTAYLSFIVVILLFGIFDGGQFIYFQF
jgi:D-alanyl-lipoteichoic acid acyltransferase DltB (MBOAT superfamily)